MRAWQAFIHVDPFAVKEDGTPRASEDDVHLAAVGALLMNELLANSRGLVERPMTIQFLSGGPKVIPFKLEDAEPAQPPSHEVKE